MRRILDGLSWLGRVLVAVLVGSLVALTVVPAGLGIGVLIVMALVTDGEALRGLFP